MHARHFVLALGLLSFWSRFVAAEVAPRQDAPKLEVNENLTVGLVDAEGNPQSRYLQAPDTQAFPELLFKVALPEGLEHHRGWALEITEPARKASVRMAYEGAIPGVLRWNGVFSDGKRIQPGSRYFTRILLAMEGRRRVASNWSFFSVELRALELAKEEPSIRLQFAPSVAAELAVLQTDSFRVLHFPVITGDLRLLWNNRNNAGIRFETTSNMIYNYRPTSTGFFYSDISFVYSYRVQGKPQRVHAPVYVPVYTNSESVPVEPVDRTLNIDVGARIFWTVLRGFGNQPIDLELGRQMQGFAASVRLDRRMGDFRLSGMGEAGYTALRGKILLLGAQAMLSYENFNNVAPGLQLRLQQYSGNAQDDPFDGVDNGGPTGILNRIVFVGLTLQFKL